MQVVLVFGTAQAPGWKGGYRQRCGGRPLEEELDFKSQKCQVSAALTFSGGGKHPSVQKQGFEPPLPPFHGTTGCYGARRHVEGREAPGSEACRIPAWPFVCTNPQAIDATSLSLSFPTCVMGLVLRASAFSGCCEIPIFTTGM